MDSPYISRVFLRAFWLRLSGGMTVNTHDVERTDGSSQFQSRRDRHSDGVIAHCRDCRGLPRNATNARAVERREALTPRRGDRHLAGVGRRSSPSYSLELAEAAAHDLHEGRRRHVLELAATYWHCADQVVPTQPPK